jgi:hypothetical protein
MSYGRDPQKEIINELKTVKTLLEEQQFELKRIQSDLQTVKSGISFQSYFQWFLFMWLTIILLYVIS